LKKYIENAKTEASKAFSGPYTFEGITARATTNLTNIIKETGMEKPEEFVEKFNTVMTADNVSEEDRLIFKQLVGSIKPEDAGKREVWEEVANNLKAQGVEITAEM
jgi:hemerythrin superfamily protein